MTRCENSCLDNGATRPDVLFRGWQKNAAAKQYITQVTY
jgi:hypothetical protein